MSEVRSQLKRMRLAERTVTVLKREIGDLQRQQQTTAIELEHAKKAVVAAEEVAIKAEGQIQNLKLDLDITKTQGIHLEASLRSRIAEFESNKSRLLDRVREMQERQDRLTSELRLWKRAQSELSGEVIAEAEERGRNTVLGQLATERRQVFEGCMKVLSYALKSICSFVAGTLSHSFEAELQESQRRLASVEKLKTLENEDRQKDSVIIHDIQQLLDACSPVERPDKSIASAVSAEEYASDEEPRARSRESRSRGSPKPADRVAAGHKRSHEIGFEGSTASEPDPSLYTINQSKKSGKDVLHPKEASHKPVVGRKKKAEEENPWDPLVVHIAKLRDIPRPYYNLEKDHMKLISKLDGVFGFGAVKIMDATNGPLVVDEPVMTRVLEEWTETSSTLVNGYISKLVARHLEVLRLSERELQLQLNQRKVLMHRLHTANRKLQEKNEEEGKFDDSSQIDDSVYVIQSRLNEFRLQAETPLLDVLKEQASRISDLAELHGQLTLRAMVTRKKAVDEENRRQKLSRNHPELTPAELEAENKASAMCSKRLLAQAKIMEERADATKISSEQLRICMLAELEDFECVVQGVLPAQVLSKLLRYSENKRQTAATIQSRHPTLDPDRNNFSRGLGTPSSGLASFNEAPLTPLSLQTPPLFQKKGRPRGATKSDLSDDASRHSFSTALSTSNMRTNKKHLESLPSFIQRPYTVSPVDDGTGIDSFSIKSLGTNPQKTRRTSRGIMSSTLPSKPSKK